jgi:hypothetical protein
MSMPEGKRMVLVLKRDRFGNWWKKNGGVDYGWTATTWEIIKKICEAKNKA